MTLEQALNFRMPNGKALGDMSTDDWRQWQKRIRAEYRMLQAMDERDVTDEQHQHFHAIADRLADAVTAINIICAEI